MFLSGLASPTIGRPWLTRAVEPWKRINCSLLAARILQHPLVATHNIHRARRRYSRFHCTWCCSLGSDQQQDCNCCIAVGACMRTVDHVAVWSPEYVPVKVITANAVVSAVGLRVQSQSWRNHGTKLKTLCVASEYCSQCAAVGLHSVKTEQTRWFSSIAQLTRPGAVIACWDLNLQKTAN